MIAIGFDPGSNSFGIGILQKDAGKIRYLHSEEIKLKGDDFYQKMQLLWRRLDSILQLYPINCGAVEEGFMGKNAKSANLLAQIRGLVMGTMIQRDLPLSFFAPRQVKLAITGNGAALKPQVETMIKILLNIQSKQLGHDESDALAVAYCNLLQRSKNNDIRS